MWEKNEAERCVPVVVAAVLNQEVILLAMMFRIKCYHTASASLDKLPFDKD